MIDLNGPLLYAETSIYKGLTSPGFYGSFFNDLPEAGRFHCNVSRSMGYCSFIPRDGEWSTPWDVKVIDMHQLPPYDPTYKLTFEEVTDKRALDIRDLTLTGRPVYISYSGGLDSTLVVAALIKNLTKEELSRITISLSADSIVENPHFYYQYIKGNFQIKDSMMNLYSDYVNNENAFCISSDLGDSIFGTELGTKMYSKYAGLVEKVSPESRKKLLDLQTKISSHESHYSNYKDIIIPYLDSLLENNVKVSFVRKLLQEHGILTWTTEDDRFGELFYHKLDHNIKTSKTPVHSLHDFWWWIIFNLKMVHCALRPSVLYATGDNRSRLIYDGVIDWFASRDYQLWSMANNNNGEKLHGITQSSYKWASRKYIYGLDKNDWYFTHKIKIASLSSILFRNYRKNLNEFDALFGIDQNCQMLRLNNPAVGQYVKDRLFNYKLNW